MSVFLSILNAITPHFRVRGNKLLLAQGHPFTRVEIDLNQVSAHKLPSLSTLQIRLLRGRWVSYSMAGFRLSEITALRTLLTQWEHLNHQSTQEQNKPLE